MDTPTVTPHATRNVAEDSLKDLNRLLNGAQVPSAELLADWQRNARANATLFNRFVFGIIEWDKALGSPGTATMAGGFQIESWRWDEVLVYTPMGVVFQKLKVPHHVSSWDGKADEKKWRVYFIIDGLGSDDEHFVEIRFNPQAEWIANTDKFSVATNGFRVIQPNILGFKRNDAIFLPVFEVVLKGLANL